MAGAIRPKSNEKIERGTARFKRECIRPGCTLSLEDARRLASEFVTYYNSVGLHSAIGFATPRDKLEGRAAKILAERERKLEAARERRRGRSRQARKREAKPATENVCFAQTAGAYC